MLHTQTWGKGDPVVLLHGFTQSGRAWEPLAGRLAADHTVTTVDLPGHGRSAGVEADLWDGAELIGEAGQAAVHSDDGKPGPAGATTADSDVSPAAATPAGSDTGPAAATPADGTGAAAWIGYSLGGRFALHLALARPELVSKLVLVSATAGIDDPDQRAARRDSDEQIARRVERDGVAAFVRWWLDRPLFATLPAAAASLDSRMGGTAAGLASSLRLAGAGRQEPLWDRLGELHMPVLVVAGALDEAYTARARRLVGAIGANAELAVLPGAGHACHLETPDAWLAVAGPFLEGRTPC